MGCRVSCCNIDPNELMASQGLSGKLGGLSKHDSSIPTLPKSASVPQKMRTMTETLLSQRPNYLELDEALSFWITHVYSPLEQTTCDIETTVALGNEDLAAPLTKTEQQTLVDILNNLIEG